MNYPELIKSILIIISFASVGSLMLLQINEYWGKKHFSLSDVDWKFYLYGGLMFGLFALISVIIESYYLALFHFLFALGQFFEMHKNLPREEPPQLINGPDGK